MLQCVLFPTLIENVGYFSFCVRLFSIVRIFRQEGQMILIQILGVEGAGTLRRYVALSSFQLLSLKEKVRISGGGQHGR